MSKADTRRRVHRRSGGMCECCGVRRAAHKHHRVNDGQGGQWTPSNIMDVCPQCHAWITTEPLAAGMFGWHLLPTDDPAVERCRVYAQGWVYLTDGGTYRPAENQWRRS